MSNPSLFDALGVFGVLFFFFVVLSFLSLVLVAIPSLSLSPAMHLFLDVSVVRGGPACRELPLRPKTSLSGRNSAISVFLSTPVFPSFSLLLSFLPLAATQRGAISHSAQRGLEELEATEQKKE